MKRTNFLNEIREELFVKLWRVCWNKSGNEEWKMPHDSCSPTQDNKKDKIFSKSFKGLNTKLVHCDII